MFPDAHNAKLHVFIQVESQNLMTNHYDDNSQDLSYSLWLLRVHDSG